MIYTLGYGNFKDYQIAQVAVKLDATVYDVRLRAWSRKAGFCKSHLESRLGSRYVSIPEWGNLAYKTPGEPHQIANFAAGLDVFKTNRRPNSILMCFCRDVQTCHRGTLATMLEAIGYEPAQEIASITDVLQPSLMPAFTAAYGR